MSSIQQGLCEKKYMHDESQLSVINPIDNIDFFYPCELEKLLYTPREIWRRLVYLNVGYRSIKGNRF